MRLSLKSKIALVGAGFVTALVVGLGVWQNRRLEHDFRTLLRAEQDALAQAVAHDVAHKIESRLWVLDHSALTVTGAMLADREARQRFVSQASAARPLFDGLVLVDIDGTVLAAEPALPGGTLVSLAGRDDVQRVIALGQPVVGRPALDRLAGRPAVSLAAPVRDVDGRVIAVLAGRLDLARAELFGKLPDAARGSTLTLRTAGADPITVHHPDPARLLAPADLALAAGDVTSERPVQVAGWTLRVHMPAAQARAPVKQARERLAQTLGAVALGTSLLLWLAVYWLLRPLSALRDTLRDLGSAPGVEALVDTSHPDERGDLAREFQVLMRRLREHQAEIAAVSDNAPLGMFRAGLDGRLAYVNDAWLELHGLAREQLDARGWVALLPESKREAAAARWQAAVQEAKPFESLLALRRAADAREIQVSVRSAPVLVDGRVVGHVGTARDVTDELRATRALQRSEATLRGVADAIPARVAVVDLEQRVRFTNAAFRRWGGERHGDGVEHLRDFLGDEEAERAAPEIARALAGDRVQWEFADRAGHHFEVDASPLRMPGGAVYGAAIVAIDVTSHKDEARALRRLARLDPLTGVLNRAGFERHLERRLEAGAGDGLAVLYIDLDRFKPVNDTHGHPVGDELLRLFAERLRGLVRPTDAVARLGGDEFAVVLEGLRERAHSEGVAAKVLDAAHQPFAIDGLRIEIGASIGIAFAEPGESDWREVVARADAMLYRAKEAGRGRFAGALG